MYKSSGSIERVVCAAGGEEEARNHGLIVELLGRPHPADPELELRNRWTVTAGILPAPKPTKESG